MDKELGDEQGDIAYGWKGKGSTVHLVTEGNSLPLVFLETVAHVSEVTVGLEVTVGGAPSKRPSQATPGQPGR
jgi:hypothetical protein